MAPKERLTYVKTSEEDITSLYDDGSVKTRKVKKAKDKVKAMKVENADRLDDPEYIPQSAESLENDIWLFEHFKVEKLPAIDSKDYRSIGLFCAIFEAAQD